MVYRSYKETIKNKIEVKARDCPFIISIYKILGLYNVNDNDPMSDAYASEWWVDTEKRVVTITPLFGYCFGIKTKQERYELSKEAVNLLITMLEEDYNPLLWFVQDMLSYMQKYGI